MWLKCLDGKYVNCDTGTFIEAVEATTGQWRLRVYGAGAVLNAGPYATLALAEDAIQRLTAGVDPNLFL